MEERLDKMARLASDSFRDYLMKHLMFNQLRQQGDVSQGLENFKRTYIGHMRKNFDKKIAADPMLKLLPKELHAMAEAMTIGVAEKAVEVFEAEMIEFMKEYSTVEP